MNGFDWNSALNRLNYEESVPRPGESSYEFYARKRREYNQDREQQMNLARYVRDAQQNQALQSQFQSMLQQAGVGGPAGGGSIWSQDEEDKRRMEQLRAQTFGELDAEKNWWDADPNALEVRGSLQSQMRGQDVPFTELVQQGLIGREQDATASALAQQQELIRQRMAAAGLSGGGGAISAQLSAQRRASADQRAAARDIRTRAELENFQARERARQEVSQLMAREAAQRMQATNKAADLRSQLEINRTRENTAGMLANAMQQQGSGLRAPQSTLPLGYQGRATGNQGPTSSYGGATFFPGANMQPFMQTSGSGGGYPQMGLGGAAGPFGAIAEAGRIADHNMSNPGFAQRGQYSSGFGRSQAYSPDNNAPLTLWDQQQQNAVSGSAHSRGSRAHHAWEAERARFNTGRNLYR